MITKILDVNAIDSQIEKNVFIKLEENGSKVICEIKDQGPGLTEEDQKKLFGKYQKLNARPTANETSTGLGLSIVKKFVIAMDGDIWCQSEQGKGPRSIWLSQRIIFKICIVPPTPKSH
jgi:signal transduction histidine kinase